MKVYLIGFMGSGKTYVGKRLAQLLDYLFIDTDSLIENTEGVTVAQLFETRGETAFRKIESERLQGLSKWDNVIVATGGGAPCFHDNMTVINKAGITVYLKTNPHLLRQRLACETEHRPVLGGRKDAELLAFIEERVEAREVFYEQADIIIYQESNEQDIAQDILKEIYERAQTASN
ncbi:MAG: shikimate kinase [Saprospiraceae bacterium]|nr:shikimate kinase [Saprospiraceae bacterium]